MYLNVDLKQAFKIIDTPECVRKDIVIPEKFPPVSHSPYRPEYDWLFTYERDLARFLEPYLKHLRHDLIGESGVLSEALSNAYCHGHKRTASLPIEVEVYKGNLGIIVKIEDSGKGFDTICLLDKFKKGKAYFHLAGNGLRKMISSSKFGVFYNRPGNAFHLLYLFNEKITTLPILISNSANLKSAPVEKLPNKNQLF